MDIDIATTPKIMSNQPIALPSITNHSSTAALSPQRSHGSSFTAISAPQSFSHSVLCPTSTLTTTSTERITLMHKGCVKSSTLLDTCRSSVLESQPTYVSSHVPMSTTKPRSPTSTPVSTIGGLIHPVKVNFSSEIFDEKHLDGIPIGDSVLFRFNGEFNLYNTTLEHPCAIKNKVQRNVLNPVYLFPVTTTAPVWFFACPADSDCYCDNRAHFALNAGHLREQYFSNAAATIVVIKTTTAQEDMDMRTVYSTKFVTAS